MIEEQDHLAPAANKDSEASVIPSESEQENGEDADDEVVVLKANIYNFQGKVTYEQEVRSDILHFKYYDDFSDEDEEDIVILNDDTSEPDERQSEEDDEEEMNTSVICEECGELFETGELENHQQLKHPPKKKNLIKFDGGNFLMLEK
eukprot:GFUD01054173.1.p1 GENE.GFUD01054173.1~~GFUD01054173.1.p1  ORF type:complete len:148 (+),score=62.16 GFUD01054173.1:220-663(+)